MWIETLFARLVEATGNNQPQKARHIAKLLKQQGWECKRIAKPKVKPGCKICEGRR